LPKATGNLYLFPDGRLINADDALLYQPLIVSETPEQALGDWREKNNLPPNR